MNVCPHCGKPTGYLMETHHQLPGIGGLIRGEAGVWARMLVLVALGVIAVLCSLQIELWLR